MNRRLERMYQRAFQTAYMRLHDLVCAGKIGLAEARGEIASDWVRSYNAHIGPLQCP